MPSQPSNNPHGRPALPEGEARSTYIKVRISEEDKIAFFAECESHCQNPSAVLRMLMDQYISEGGIF